MCAQVLRVNTFRTNGLDSPVVSYTNSKLTMPCHHCCNLDDGIDIRFGKDAFSARTFNVETEDSQGCDFRVFAIRRVRDEVFVAVVRRSEAQTYWQLTSIWHNDRFSLSPSTSYLPPGNSTQFIPTICH